MDNLSEMINTFVSKNMLRILIFLLTMMIGMIVGLNGARAATKSPLPTPTPTPATSPVPITAGTVTDVSGASLTIKSDSGQSTSLAFSPSVRVEAPGLTSIKGKPTVKNIAVNDIVAAVTPDQTTASVVVIAAKNGAAPAMDKTFFGIVSSREATSSGTILSLKAPSGDQFAKALVATTTKIIAKGIDKSTSDDIKADDKVLVVGPTNKQDVILAQKLYLIPGQARGLLKNLMNSLSPSPSTATQSGSIKTPKPSSKSASADATH